MERAPIDVFIARQPIFDRDQKVRGYELLARGSGENRFPGGDPEAATAIQLEKALLTFGLKLLTSGRDAYLNASRTLLTHDHWRMLPAERTVLEVLETVAPDDAIVQACQRAVDGGFRIALDDFTYGPAYERLLDLAHIVKVDFRQQDAVARRALVRRLVPRGLVLLAEKIESQEEWREAAGEGYGLFQGYFFCKPQMLRARELAPARVLYLRLLHEVHAPDIDIDAVEALIRQDVALAVKLLRYLHSAALAWTREVHTVRQALLQLGERALRQWVSLVAVFGLAQGKPQELIVVALARARFAGQLAGASGQPQFETEAFLAGLLSVLDALTDQPLGRALDAIAIPDAVRGALLAGAPPVGDILGLVLAWERGEWDTAAALVGRLGVGEEAVAACYAESVLWAEDRAQP